VVLVVLEVVTALVVQYQVVGLTTMVAAILAQVLVQIHYMHFTDQVVVVVEQVVHPLAQHVLQVAQVAQVELMLAVLAVLAVMVALQLAQLNKLDSLVLLEFLQVEAAAVAEALLLVIQNKYLHQQLPVQQVAMVREEQSSCITHKKYYVRNA
jgi:hypothetical protein